MRNEILKYRNILKVIIFLIGGLVIFQKVQNIISPKYFANGIYREGDTDKFDEFYSLEPDSIDYLVLGPSTSFYSINPMSIYAQTGIKGFSLGSTVQGIGGSYFMLVECLKYQTPDILFIDLSGLLYDSYATNDEKNTAPITKLISGMKFSANKINACKELSNKYKGFIEYMIPMIPFHDRWSVLVEDDFHHDNSSYFLKGSYTGFRSNNYTGIIRKSKSNHYIDFNSYDESKNENQTIEVPENNIKYFERIVNLAEDNDIKIVPFFSTSSYRTEEQKNCLEKILETYGLSLCFSDTDSMGIDWLSDTVDSGWHLNYWGSSKFSKAVSDYLLAYYDGRQEEDYDKEYDGDLPLYEEYEVNNLFSSKQEALQYLMYLNLNKDKRVIFISGCDEVTMGVDDDIYSALHNLGIRESYENHVQDSYICILNRGNLEFEQFLSGAMVLEDNLDVKDRKIMFCLKSAGFPWGNTSKIEINGIDYSCNKRGLNIVELDADSGKLISSGCIDTYLSECTVSYKEKYKPKIFDCQCIPDGEYGIYPFDSGEYAVDIARGTTNEDENVQLWFDTGDIPQQFYIQYEGNGLYTIKAMCSDKYLTAYNFGTKKGTNIVQETYSGLANQRWFIYQSNDGSYKIESLYNHLMIDVAGGVAFEGCNIQLYENNYCNCQKYRLMRQKSNT